jgi:uncharacterized protein
VLGNHDHYAHAPSVARLVGAGSVDLLVNDARTLRVDGARLHVLGTDNTGFGQNFADLGRTLARAEPDGDDAFVLLAHDPTFWDATSGSGPRRSTSRSAGTPTAGRWGSSWGRSGGASRGWSTGAGPGSTAEDGPAGRQHLYVNRGLSTVGPPVRLGIRPEITILTLVRAA